MKLFDEMLTIRLSDGKHIDTNGIKTTKTKINFSFKLSVTMECNTHFETNEIIVKIKWPKMMELFTNGPYVNFTQF